jgi:hypothetical protein
VEARALLEGGSSSARKAGIGQVVWRFASDPDAAINLLLGHEAGSNGAGGPDRAGSPAGGGLII